MKRDPDELNLRDAFRPIPDACRDALMDAARSVREEEKMKRFTFRTVLIVALDTSHPAGGGTTAAAGGPQQNPWPGGFLWRQLWHEGAQGCPGDHAAYRKAGKQNPGRHHLYTP